MTTTVQRFALRAALVALGAGATLTIGPPADAADDRPDFQMSFPCGQRWNGSTRATHSPSSLSIDWNRDAYDEGKPVIASAPGVVTSVVNLGDRSYGLYVVIDHGHGWTSLHAHLSRALVVPGQRVDEGQLVALLGNSGGSSGAHLHYEQRLNKVVQHAVFNGTRFDYGSWLRSRNCVDVPLAGDWNGDRVSDVGVFARNRAGVFRKRIPGAKTVSTRFGTPTDQPVVGDWDGDGQYDVGVWSALKARFRLRYDDGSVRRIRFGDANDVPVSGDWNGDGRWDVGVWDPQSATFFLRNANGAFSTRVFGSTTAIPVTGDWDGDGRWDVGTYDPPSTTFALRRSDGTVQNRRFGTPTSLPVVGFFNGDSVSDIGVWDTTTGVFTERVRAKRSTRIRFGRIR